MSEPGLRRCAAHGVPTRVDCVVCGAPICLRCQVETEDGLQCLSCAAGAPPVSGPLAPAAAPPARRTSAVQATSGRRPHPVAAIVAGGLLLASSVVVLGVAVSSRRDAGTSTFGRWEPAPELTSLRGPTTAVKLADGRVLAVGGGIGAIPLAGTEVYDPSTARWSRAGDLNHARRGHAAVLLRDGRVLVAGGLAGDQVLASVEVYQPSTGAWADTSPMRERRVGAVLATLSDGRVLAAGGIGADGRSLSSAEVFDPLASAWTNVPIGMTDARSGAAAAALNDGRILIVGGLDSSAAASTVLATAELFDPVGDVFSRTGSLREARQDLTATRLADGTVLAAGGSTEATSLSSAETFNPARGTWTSTGSMAASRRLHGASLLAGGEVLVSAGETLQRGSRTALTSAEVFDPIAGRWRSAAQMACPRRAAAQVSLDDGTVLVVGGDAAIPSEPPTAQSCVERFVPGRSAPSS